MTTTTKRPRRTRTTGPRAHGARTPRVWNTWTCPNCTGKTYEPRKRCSDCGTFRY